MNLYKLHPAYAAAKASGMTDNEFCDVLNKSRRKQSQYALDKLLNDAKRSDEPRPQEPKLTYL